MGFKTKIININRGLNIESWETSPSIQNREMKKNQQERLRGVTSKIEREPRQNLWSRRSKD